jgi:hypothetical protein
VVELLESLSEVWGWWTHAKLWQTRGKVGVNSVESLEMMLAIASQEGITVRSEWLGGVRGGLVRVGRRAFLFVAESLTVPEQLEQVRLALGELDWTETEHAGAMARLLGG